MITRTDIAAHLEQSVRLGVLKGAEGYVPLRNQFCGELPSDGAYELYTDMGDVPMPQLTGGKQGAAGTDSRTGAPVNGQMGVSVPGAFGSAGERSTLVYNLDWTIEIPIEHNAIEDDRAGDLEAWARSAMANFEKHKDKMAFQALNLGATTTFLGNCYDGVPLFSASHSYPNAKYVTAQSNLLTTALSYDNAIAAMIAGGGLLDDQGEPLGHNHNLLIHALELKKTAVQITQNPNEPDSADRNINAMNDLIRLQAPGGWLDSTAWFMVDPMGPKPMNIQNRMNPTLTIIDDERAEIRYFRLKARYNIFPAVWTKVLQGNS